MNLGFWNGTGFESADHPPLPNDSRKFHAHSVVGPFEKNTLDGEGMSIGRLSCLVFFAPNRHFSQRFACKTQHSTVPFQHVVSQLFLSLYELQKRSLTIA